MPTVRRILGSLLPLFLLPCVIACSSDKGSSMSGDAGVKGMPSICDLGPACRMISMACMPKDDGTAGTIHDCHMAGMETAIESQCEQKLSACVTACNAAPGFGDAGGFMSMCGDGGK